ncbi:hypothetical protein BGW80DRAFT_1286362, partial [Lactifluus volemus]
MLDPLPISWLSLEVRPSHCPQQTLALASRTQCRRSSSLIGRNPRFTTQSTPCSRSSGCP